MVALRLTVLVDFEHRNRSFALRQLALSFAIYAAMVLSLYCNFIFAIACVFLKLKAITLSPKRGGTVRGLREMCEKVEF
jgi:hypothetical protein